ncbi:MAG: hypothetical protein KDA99_09135, partial [Planctomycetales bacterium]|nr:hypothetical protein [Planctomycetales bacterium]
MGSTEIRRDYGRRAVRSAVVVVIAVCLTEWCDSNKTLGQTNRETRRDPMTPIEDDARLPRVLLLGDSISIGYTLPVRDLLAGEANVHRPNENCGPTTRGVERIDAWLGDKPWDVIHVNFGLHDLKYCDDEGNLVAVGDGHVQVPPDAYQANLRQLLARLRATGARIIWTTTTPVPEGAKGRVVGDAAKYNTLALQVAYRELGQDLFVDDLYALAKEKQAELQQPANVHFTNDGSKVLAEQVSNAIRAALASRNATASATARGIVYEDVNSNQKFDDGDRPLPEVRVSNGEQIVKTDAEGRYVLPVTDDTILFVIKPRGYRSPVNELQLPQFYYVHKPNGSPGLQFPGVAPTGPLPESVDFPLYAQEEPEQFKALLFGDPQPRDQREVDYIAHDVVEELRGTDAAFGVTLGDIVFDDLSMFQPQARVIAVLGIPWFNVIGNHDINY